MEKMASKDTQEQAEFRQYCRDWLAQNKPGEPPVRLPLTALEIMTEEQMAYLHTWQKAAYGAGRGSGAGCISLPASRDTEYDLCTVRLWVRR